VEAAGIVLAEEVSRLGITHAGFAMTSRGDGKAIGQRYWWSPVEQGGGAGLAYPYGSVARLILL